MTPEFQTYKNMTARSRCEIPRVTLLGTEKDWIQLRNKINILPDYDYPGSTQMRDWHRYLVPVLDKFVESAQGENTTEFWHNILTNSKLARWKQKGRITGWASVFTVFDVKGNWIAAPGEEDKTVRYTDSGRMIDPPTPWPVVEHR